MSYFLKIPEDTFYGEKLERKKRFLAERGRKIFDPVRAHQAYDTVELKNQVAERKANEQAERNRELTFDQAARRLDHVHQIIEEKQCAAKKTRAQEVEEYRTLFQRKERSETFELNDPDALKKQRPIGADGDYSTYGPSSILTFESDKIRQPQDLKNNILRQRDDLARQMDEQQVKKDFERHLNNVAHNEKIAQGNKLDNLDTASQELQKAMKMANREYNEKLAAFKADAKRRSAALDEKDRQTHVNNMMNSNMMNEKPTNPRDHKGIPPDQQAKIYETWNEQKHEIQNARNQEREERSTWDNYFRAVCNENKNEQKALQEERATLRKRIDAVNQKEVFENRERKKTNNVVLFDCANPTEEFFEQFQRDPR